MNVVEALALVRDETGTAPLWQAAHVLAAAVERVREIHMLRDDDMCRECLDDYPCATLRALDDSR